MLKKILTLLNKVIPKQNIILFNSYPAYEEYFPGPVVSNFTEFTNYIKDPDPIDEKYRSHREKLSNMFHKYKDGNSAERICIIFWPKEDNK